MSEHPDDQQSSSWPGAQFLAETGEEAVDEASQQGAGEEIPAGVGAFRTTLL